MARIIDATGGAEPQQGAIRVQAQGQESIALPHADYIANADILRDGQDLILRHPDGGEFVIEGYFSGMSSPVLTADNGAALTPAMVKSFVQPADHAQFAQAQAMNDASPAGHVSEVTGKVTIIHADGTTETATVGTAIYEGDIVETDEGGAVNILFVDETSFAVSSNARLSIDEYVFDASSGGGTTNFSVLRGMFVFVSGLIGRDDPDDVEIHTPVGSIGIRGTTIAGNADTGEITVLEGAIVLRTMDGRTEMTLAAQFETARFNAASGQIENMGVQTGGDIADRFTTLQTVVPALFSTMPHTPGEAPANMPQQTAPEHGSQQATPPAELPPPGGYNETSFDGGTNAGFAAAAHPGGEHGPQTPLFMPPPPVTAPLTAAPANDGAHHIIPPPPPAQLLVPSPPPVNNNTQPGTTPAGGPDPDMTINITAAGNYFGGAGNDTFVIQTPTFGTIGGGAGHDRIIVAPSAGGLPSITPAMMHGVEEFIATNGVADSINMMYSPAMTANNIGNNLLIRLDASDTLSMNFQNMGFRMTDMGADWVTIANGTQSVRIETPNLMQLNLSGVQAMDVGTVLSDGSIFAGYGPTNEMLFVSPVSSGPLSWNDGGIYYTNIAGGTINGAMNTANLIGSDSNNIAAGIQPHMAAQYADSLNAHGYANWHLPSLQELALLFQNNAALGLGGSNTYWSSNQSATSAAWAIDFSNGQQLQIGKTAAHEVIAVRTVMGPGLDNILLGGPTGDNMFMNTATAHVSLRDGNDSLHIMNNNVAGSYFDGGQGLDQFIIHANGSLDLTALGAIGLNNFEEIAFEGTGAQTVRLSIDQILTLMKQAQLDTLTISDTGAGAATLEVTGTGGAGLNSTNDYGTVGSHVYEYVIGANTYTLLIADTVTVAPL